ncbi:NAD(P)-binding protein [Cystobasidium minutum MCA 4210]|uniref:NAD(P)-binding protein n=1 Tax=Cystobasidium minutum MCA 4210 TaxID=1397322 RepID=UPI0034CDFA3B|eukprot:jgi/Rhomi1/211437/estExt_Genemark1.C_4_t30119
MTVSPGAIWLITGCSSGFGRDLALAGLRHGYRVIATARKLAAIADLEAEGAAILQLDVTASPEALAAFAKEALQIYGGLDVLVSNAGFCQSGALEETSHEQRLAQFATNFFGAINLTNAFLPHLRQQRSGTIVNISSMGGILNNAGAGIYCASKAALDSISDTWSRELRPFNIRCVSVQPGAFATAVGSAANFKRGETYIKGYDTAHGWIDMLSGEGGNEPGDPRKGAERIIQLVQLETLPMRFALGDDGWDLVTQSHSEIIDGYKKYETLSKGTNRDGLNSSNGASMLKEKFAS